VITGRVLDEDGEPLARATVSVLRQQYVRGEKQLATAGTGQSDDRGMYRIFGLMPGDYFVSASNVADRMPGPMVDPAGGGVAHSTEAPGSAPPFSPGVIAATDAGRLKLATGQELTSIDFQLQIVPLATVKGIVVGGGGGTVMLVPEEGALGGGRG